MSWYLANEKELIDQFASVSGLADLRRASEPCPALHDFFEEGVTVNVSQCIEELNQLANTTRDEDVRVTAQGLAKLMRGQKVAVITQGFGYDADEEEDETTSESLDPPEPAKPAGPVARKLKKKATPKKTPAARKARKKAAPRKGRAWFETKVAELKAEAEKLPADRQEQFKRKLKERK
jgi:hypothetical protein